MYVLQICHPWNITNSIDLEGIDVPYSIVQFMLLKKAGKINICLFVTIITLLLYEYLGLMYN